MKFSVKQNQSADGDTSECKRLTEVRVAKIMDAKTFSLAVLY